jgi:peptidoglycan/LPS O-acetylase OafA/YrhL
MQERPIGDASAVRQVRQFYALDAFRGLAAIGVAIFHFRWTHPELAGSALFERLFNLLDFFFVLSGFMLAHAYLSRPLALGNFVWRRLARLYPLHLFALLMFLLLQLAKLAAAQLGVPVQQDAFQGMNAQNFLDALLLLQATGLLWHEISWNYPAWTVSAEFLGAVIVYALAVGFGRRALEPLCLALVAGCLAYLIAFSVEPSDYGPDALVRTLYALALGCLLHRLHAQFDLIRGPVWGTIAELLVLGVVALLIGMPATRPYWYLVTLALAGVIYVFAAEQGLISTLARKLQLHRLGTGSYSIYLNHALIGALFSKVFLTLAPMLGISGRLSVMVYVPIFLALLMLYSRWTLHTIERPGRQLWLRAQPLVFEALSKLALPQRTGGDRAVRQP